jgi:hypothetical protein
MVVDHAGKPVDGVTVSIVNSAYAATTGVDGRYRVEFAPGAFTVRYAKPGMTTTTVTHAIQVPTEFPAANIEMLTIPEEQGLYFLADTGLVRIDRAQMERQTSADGWFSVGYKYHCTSEGSLKVKAGKVRFVDTTPGAVLPAMTGGYGLVLDETTREGFNGVFKDEKQRLGEEELVVRSFDAKPGRYAFVTFKSDRSDNMKLDIESGCYPFAVE